ncbi:MAG: DNA-processing protein DprA [Actinomycetota bacterium]
MPVDEGAPRPEGFPSDFGQGSGDADAALALRCLLGITPRDLHELIWREGSAAASVQAIMAGAAGSDNDRSFLEETTPTHVRRRLDAAGVRFALAGDPEYWPAFLRLADPPVGLFLRGRPLRLGDRRVAVVGSRRPSKLGIDAARDLGRGLAASGVVVTSGGAIGIDARAHEGALDAGGTTVAVLGSGIDVEYPATNRALLREIVQRGTLVSEYPPGVPAEPFRFPARNRLIAGLSIGVVIVEGVARSGTRSTADYASQLGIDVFAVPGPVNSPLTEAPHELIRDGARLIRGAEDLLDDLGLESGGAALASLDGLPPDEGLALAALIEPMLPDAVSRITGLSIPDTVTALIRLEVRGLVEGVGGRFQRTFRPAAQA